MIKLFLITIMNLNVQDLNMLPNVPMLKIQHSNLDCFDFCLQVMHRLEDHSYLKNKRNKGEDSQSCCWGWSTVKNHSCNRW